MKTRREFIQISAGGATALALGLGTVKFSKKAFANSSTIVIVKDQNASQGINLNEPIIQKMLDAGIKKLTNKSSLKDAWKSIIPNTSYKVAIKVNYLNSRLPSHPEVIRSVIKRLNEIGIENNNIIIYDYEFSSGIITRIRKRVNIQGINYRGVGSTTQKSLSCQYGYCPPVYLTNILQGNVYLINIPVLKGHGIPQSVTFALKNHYGSISNPSALHSNIYHVIAALNSLPEIKNKTRLVIGDAILASTPLNPFASPNCAPNKLLLSQDPVAVDTEGIKILRSCPQASTYSTNLVTVAQNYGIGSANPTVINIDTGTLDTTPPQAPTGLTISKGG